MKATKQKIEELFTLKSNRAVDIIFSENKIDQIHEFYAVLQENKKANTIALKQTLQNNYEKMLYCSELLDQVKKYSEAVKEVAEVIERQMGGVEGKLEIDNQKQQNGLSKIEGLIRKNRFSQAMAESFKQQSSLGSSQRYFVRYLRVEIIHKMQRYICLNRLDKQMMEECAKCLQELLFEKCVPQLTIRRNAEEWIKDFDEKSLFDLTNKRIEQLKRVENKKQLQATMYQILFEYKLGKIKNKFKTEHNSSYFEQYFQELATILKLYKNMKVQTRPGRHLSAIFYDCTAQLKSQLSSIFIYRSPSDQIVFKCQLYQQLVSSPRFEAIITSFYNQISEGSGEVQNPLKFIKELWHNYFINLVDLRLEQANPLARLPSLKQHTSMENSIPEELKIYLHDYSLEQSLHFIAQYELKLKVLVNNVTPIIQKCTPAELESLKQKFNSKIEQICVRCVQFSASLEKEGSILGLRKFTLLKVLVHMLAGQIRKINQQYNMGLEEKQIISRLRINNPESFWRCFIDRFRPQDSIHDAIIEFDRFFIGYIEGVQPHLHDAIISVVSQVSIEILTFIKEWAVGKEKDMMIHTVQSLRQKKEKVTILETIAVPYLARDIFQCAMKPICLSQQLYEEHMVCKPSKAVVRPTIMGVEDFEIGEKQEKQELVKVKIGKSIMNIGNNLITGFMKKKEPLKQ